MLDIVLYHPQIPQNTGNVIRLCANSNCALHLIQPLGFILDDKRLKRAGLDYHEWARVQTHLSIAAYQRTQPQGRCIAIETIGTLRYDEVQYQPGDSLWFGAETYGLTKDALEILKPDAIVRIPQTNYTRSLNLSNSVAIVVYEALKQLGFPFEATIAPIRN